MKKVFELMICMLLVAQQTIAQIDISLVPEKYQSNMFPGFSIMNPIDIGVMKKADPYKVRTTQVMEYDMIPVDSDSVRKIGYLNNMIKVRYDKEGRKVNMGQDDKDGGYTSKYYYCKHGYTDSFVSYNNPKGRWGTAVAGSGVNIYKFNRHGKPIDYFHIYYDTLYYKNRYHHCLMKWHYSLFGRLKNKQEWYIDDTNTSIKLPEHPDFNKQYIYDLRGRLRVILDIDSTPGWRTRTKWQLICWTAFWRKRTDCDSLREKISPRFKHCEFLEIVFYKHRKPVYHYREGGADGSLTETITYNSKGDIAGLRCTYPGRRNCTSPAKIDTLYFSYHYNEDGSIYSLERVPEKDSYYYIRANCRLVQYFNQYGQVVKKIRYNKAQTEQWVERYKYYHEYRLPLCAP